MPGDPRGGRVVPRCQLQTSSRCDAQTPEAKEHFINLADQWERLAGELETTKVFLKTMREIEPK
jgi:hypothetical protein